MKRILFLLAAVMAVFRAFGYETLTSDKLRVWAVFSDPIVADGETVNYITVYQHDDDDLDYTAFNMEFILPEGFRVNKVKQGRDMVNDIKFSDRATTTHAISCNLKDGVDLRIIGDSSINADLYKDDEDGNLIDELFTVGLIAEPTLKTGTYQVEMKGIKFVHKTGDAKIPTCDPTTYNVYIENPSDPSTGLEEISADELDPDDCYDLMGRRIDPRKAHATVIVTKGRKYYVK
ncbi:MAG: hypothetical protein K2H87_00460 [Duncaniella sp.]|nr:hypothetical protein [Duncaniella sp.]